MNPTCAGCKKQIDERKPFVCAEFVKGKSASFVFRPDTGHHVMDSWAMAGAPSFYCMPCWRKK